MACGSKHGPKRQNGKTRHRQLSEGALAPRRALAPLVQDASEAHEYACFLLMASRASRSVRGSRNLLPGAVRAAQNWLVTCLERKIIKYPSKTMSQVEANPAASSSNDLSLSINHAPQGLRPLVLAP